MSRRLCSWCHESNRAFAVTRIPHIHEWACQRHAEEFWQGVVRCAVALRELDALQDAALAASVEPEPVETYIAEEWS